MEFLGLSSSEWQEIGLAVLYLVVAAIVARLLLWILDKVVARFSRRTDTGLDDAILDAIRIPLFWLVMFFALQHALDQLTFLPPNWRDGRENLIFVLYLLLGYVFLYRLISNLVKWYTEEVARHTESKLDEQVLPFARRVTLILLTLIVCIVALSHFGIDVSALVTTLGVGSLAVALAAKDTLADMISGFAIITDRPFTLGQRIEILELNTWGDVQDIGLRTTRIRTRDNRMVVVPNSTISKNLIVNHSIPSTMYRVETHVGVGYGTDVDYARQVLIDAVRAEDWVMKDQRIEALFIRWGDSAMIFRVRCWIEHYVETRRIMDKLNSCLYKAIDEAGIDSPFPTQTLYHRVAPEDRDGLVAVLKDAQLDN